MLHNEHFSSKHILKILIIDNHVLFRDGLTILLESQPEFRVVAQADTIAEGMELIAECDPEVILMDVNLPDGSGLEATQRIISLWPEKNVVILSIDDSEDFILSAILHGAVGFIAKHMPKAHFLESIKGIQRGEAAISRRMTRLLIQDYTRMSKLNRPEVDAAMAALTFRELEVFGMLGSGASNQEIADALNIAENTVKSHVHKIFDKLNIRSRAEVRTFAQRIGQTDNGHIRK